jgi:hypothetical protein
MSIVAEKKLEIDEGSVIYDVTLGLGEEDEYPGEAMEAILSHLDASARDGTKVRLLIVRV